MEMLFDIVYSKIPNEKHNPDLKKKKKNITYGFRTDIIRDVSLVRTPN
jgi:hypothetical protein